MLIAIIAFFGKMRLQKDVIVQFRRKSQALSVGKVLDIDTDEFLTNSLNVMDKIYPLQL